MTREDFDVISTYSASCRKGRFLAAAILAFLLVSGCGALFQTRPVSPRPDSWAAPVELPGVPNLHRVSENLYRSAQPTAEGFKNLARMGVKTVVNLRESEADRKLSAGTGITIVEIPVNVSSPTREQVLRFLKIATDPARAPVLVHCRYGSDRTGAFCAVYRAAVMGWPVEEAIREMTGGGFGFHAIWSNLPVFIRGLDIPALRRDAGIPGPPLSFMEKERDTGSRRMTGLEYPAVLEEFLAGKTPKTGAGEKVAEGVGFEPTGLSPNGFQDRRLRPLGHPSAARHTS